MLGTIVKNARHEVIAADSDFKGDGSHNDDQFFSYLTQNTKNALPNGMSMQDRRRFAEMFGLPTANLQSGVSVSSLDRPLTSEGQRHGRNNLAAPPGGSVWNSSSSSSSSSDSSMSSNMEAEIEPFSAFKKRVTQHGYVLYNSIVDEDNPQKERLRTVLHTLAGTEKDPLLRQAMGFMSHEDIDAVLKFIM